MTRLGEILRLRKVYLVSWKIVEPSFATFNAAVKFFIVSKWPKIEREFCHLVTLVFTSARQSLVGNRFPFKSVNIVSVTSIKDNLVVNEHKLLRAFSSNGTFLNFHYLVSKTCFTISYICANSQRRFAADD